MIFNDFIRPTQLYLIISLLKILVIKLSSLGDIVHAIPAVNALRQVYPNAEIDWLIYEQFAGLIENQSSISKIHKLPNKHFNTLYKTIKELQKENYNIVIDLQGLIKTAIAARLISSRCLGFSKPREIPAAIVYSQQFNVGNTMDSSMHIVDRNLELIRNLAGVKAISISFGELQQEKIKSEKTKLCIIPSTTWETKFWLPEYWLELIQKAHERNYEIYILGTIKDLPQIEKITYQLKSPFHLVLNKSLKELPGFFAEMDIVIGVDTGPLHIAAASHYGSKVTKIIGLYGPTSGSRTGPYGFDYISTEKITGKKASHKRYNDKSMALIKPELLLNHI